MFIQCEGQSTINTHHVCNMIHNGKKVEFYFDTMTARENWNFDDEKKAKEDYEQITELMGATKIS